jgi:probable phosphoglycerate mutase
MSHEFDDAQALYTSVLPRAIQTASIISPGLPSSLRAVQDCDLCELHPGEADGLTWQQMIDAFGAPDWDLDPGQAIAPGGESWLGFYDRCCRALAAIVERHAGQRVILVVHGGVIEQAMKLVYDSAPEVRLRLLTENCSMTEIEFNGERRRLLRYNDRAPLAAE